MYVFFHISDLLKLHKDETDVDFFVKNVNSNYSREFSLTSSDVIHSLKHLVQWVCDLSLNLAGGAPDFRQRKGPGVGRNDS